MKSASLLSALVLAAAPAAAQTVMVPTTTESNGFVTTQGFSSSRLMPLDDPTSAMDGCINVPGQAHNSADCGRIVWMDPNTVLPDKPLDQLTGAELNLLRNARILLGRVRGQEPAPAPAAPANGR